MADARSRPQRAVEDACPGVDGARRLSQVRMVQVCLDIPRDLATAEAAFWREASQWRWVLSDDLEFLGKLDPDGASPVQLLRRLLRHRQPAGLRLRVASPARFRTRSHRVRLCVRANERQIEPGGQLCLCRPQSP